MKRGSSHVQARPHCMRHRCGGVVQVGVVAGVVVRHSGILHVEVRGGGVRIMGAM